MRDVKLPSGAVLKVHPASWSESKELYQTMLAEAKNVVVTSRTDLAGVYKDLFCIGFSSKAIEKCLWDCFKYCTYDNGKGAMKIKEDTFEPIEARGDYLTICMEVSKENVLPFAKSLYAEYRHIIQTILNTPV